MWKQLDADKILDVCSSFALRSWQVIRLYELFVLNKSFSVDLPRQVGKSHFACVASTLGALIVYPRSDMRRAIHQSKYGQFIDKKNCYLSKTFDARGLSRGQIIIYDEGSPNEIHPYIKENHIVACIYTSREKEVSDICRDKYLQPNYPSLIERIRQLEEENRILQASW